MSGTLQYWTSKIKFSSLPEFDRILQPTLIDLMCKLQYDCIGRCMYFRHNLNSSGYYEFSVAGKSFHTNRSRMRSCAVQINKSELSLCNTSSIIKGKQWQIWYHCSKPEFRNNS